MLILCEINGLNLLFSSQEPIIFCMKQKFRFFQQCTMAAGLKAGGFTFCVRETLIQ